MKITEEEVMHVADLARLTLSQEELARFINELDSILDYMDILSEIDTEGIEPTVHTLSITNALREDQVLISQSRDDALTNAPKHMGGTIVVPKVIE
ncbi:MAG: Asp-tRNA(Asn)/Glu-tRNA(Gln) amidotransferase subunit GatC [Desulfomonilia bacterium]